MGNQTLQTMVLCVVLLAGSFAAGFAFLPSAPRAEPGEPVAPPPPPTEAPPVMADAEVKGDQGAAPARDQEPREAPAKPRKRRADVPPPQPPPGRPLARAELSNCFGGGIGRRVTWVGERIVHQSARVNNKEGSQHIMKGKGPQGEFSLDFLFIAEETGPFKSDFRLPTMEEMRQRLEERKALKTRQARLEYEKRHATTFTVTGVISRLDTLFLIGQGTYHDVPVLADVTITRNR